MLGAAFELAWLIDAIKSATLQSTVMMGRLQDGSINVKVSNKVEKENRSFFVLNMVFLLFPAVNGLFIKIEKSFNKHLKRIHKESQFLKTCNLLHRKIKSFRIIFAKRATGMVSILLNSRDLPFA